MHGSFFFNFFCINCEVAKTIPPRLPNSHAKPQKKPSATIVEPDSISRTYYNGTISVFSLTCICTAIYFTPEKAALNSPGSIIKNINWIFPHSVLYSQGLSLLFKITLIIPSAFLNKQVFHLWQILL